MIPAGVIIKKGEILNKNLSLIADQSCYTGAKISGIVNGNVNTVKGDGCGKWYPSNVHVLIEKGGVVKGNIFADHVIVGGEVQGKIVAQYVTILPEGKVEGEIFSHHKVEGEYDPPPFLKECNNCTDTTVIALKQLEEKIFN